MDWKQTIIRTSDSMVYRRIDAKVSLDELIFLCDLRRLIHLLVLAPNSDQSINYTNFFGLFSYSFYMISEHKNHVNF